MIIKFDVFANQLDRDIPVHMYLPDNYMNEHKDYPVLYMFDGHNLFLDEDATYGRSWRLRQEIPGVFPDLIVVGIECSHHGYDRLAEYAPYAFYDKEFGKAFPGHGSMTMDFILSDLKPYIDEHFPTKRGRMYTWIGGSSCGGLMALYGLYAYSSTFSKGLVISPYIVPSQSAILAGIASSYIKHPSSAYISWGAAEGSRGHEFVEETKAITEISNLLLKKGVKLEFNLKMYGRHCEEDWQKEAPEFLEFLK